jgi:hypothetical protein
MGQGIRWEADMQATGQETLCIPEIHSLFVRRKKFNSFLTVAASPCKAPQSMWSKASRFSGFGNFCIDIWCVSLDGGATCRKASTYKRQHEQRRNTDIRSRLEGDSKPQSQWWSGRKMALDCAITVVDIIRPPLHWNPFLHYPPILGLSRDFPLRFPGQYNLCFS